MIQFQKNLFIRLEMIKKNVRILVMFVQKFVLLIIVKINFQQNVLSVK